MVLLTLGLALKLPAGKPRVSAVMVVSVIATSRLQKRNKFISCKTHSLFENVLGKMQHSCCIYLYDQNSCAVFSAYLMLFTWLIYVEEFHSRQAPQIH